MEKVLFDCDNTMGLPKKDVDDGLTLLYLLGREDVELLGVSSTFGNGTLAQANQVTKQMIEELDITDFNLHSGAANANDIDTAAADFLVKTAKENPGEITLLATGPLTNLKAAYKKDDQFFTYLKQIVVMGGITEPLYFGDKEVSELNFSCDGEATELVLKADVPVMVASGNLCLEAFFGSEEWKTLSNKQNDNYKYISDYIKDWYDYGEELINTKGFYMWDLVSAVYVTSPELFENQYYTLNSKLDDLKTGTLIVDISDKSRDIRNEGVINIPTGIKDIKKFKDAIFAAWLNF
ncbi:nucleoside hydrolase [Orenia marismortui]|uniref:nucleoside hydrolase n=1 Tax=Orenia marismortui TaxID=46469 RepID=UPI0003618D46|nr:nucleoside hydrolase [Orenia marismortui]